MFEILQELKVYTLIRSSYVVPEDLAAVKLHWHDCYQFVYARKGKGSIITEQETITLSENEAVIIRRNEPHALVSCADKFETYEVKFIVCDEEKDLLKDTCRYLCRDELGEISLALRQLERESDKLDELSREIVAVELYKILLLMQRRQKQSVREKKRVSSEAQEAVGDKLLRKIDAFIEENMSRNITVKDVADYVCIEYKYFSHYFASCYGLRLKQYITGKQVAKAKELIVNTDLNMAAIAERCGFGDSRYLARMFKACEKLSPTEYRKLFQTNHAVKLEAEPASFWDSADGKPESGGRKALVQHLDSACGDDKGVCM